MSPQAASLLYAVLIFGLFALSRDRETPTSKALWIAVIWLALGGSRNISEWLGPGAPLDQDRYVEGNALDRNVLTALLLVGVIVLARRGFELGRFTRANTAIVLYVSYCLISVLWSPYPDVAFKRWVRALGDLVIVLVVLTDANRLTALKRFLARAGFVLVPVSILLIRYYPDFGRGYSRWTGAAYWTGVTTDKNALGMICMVFGLGSAWYLVQAYRGDAQPRGMKPLIAHAAFVAMALWLFIKADSATSIACFVLGTAITVLTGLPVVARNRGFVHLLVVAILSVVVAALFLNTGSSLVETLGRDSTITGRTDIWRLVLGMTDNRLIGTGFESFWLGDRLERMARIYYNHPNQAHNGYIEVFLNLGWVGVTLLAAVIISGYRKVLTAVGRQAPAANLRLAYFVVAVIYNLTEGAVQMMHPVWIMFLLATLVVPEPAIPDARSQRGRDALVSAADAPPDHAALQHNFSLPG